MKRPAADTTGDAQTIHNDDHQQRAGKTARLVTIVPEHKSTSPTPRQDKRTPPVQDLPPHEALNDGQRIDIALVDLFAGLRTVHVAAKSTRVNFVLCAAAEKCPFANKLAKNNRIMETLFEDVRSMNKNWGKNFISDAITLGAKCILVIGGVPCKGVSKARGTNRENLKNKDSILFYEATRILELIRQAAGGKIIVRHIIENVIMDEDLENMISEYLAGRPTKIPAGPVCAANRDRLFWLDFTISPMRHMG